MNGGGMKHHYQVGAQQLDQKLIRLSWRKLSFSMLPDVLENFHSMPDFFLTPVEANFMRRSQPYHTNRLI